MYATKDLFVGRRAHRYWTTCCLSSPRTNSHVSATKPIKENETNKVWLKIWVRSSRSRDSLKVLFQRKLCCALQQVLLFGLWKWKEESISSSMSKLAMSHSRNHIYVHTDRQCVQLNQVVCVWSVVCFSVWLGKQAGRLVCAEGVFYTIINYERRTLLTKLSNHNISRKERKTMVSIYLYTHVLVTCTMPIDSCLLPFRVGILRCAYQKWQIYVYTYVHISTI